MIKSIWINFCGFVVDKCFAFSDWLEGKEKEPVCDMDKGCEIKGLDEVRKGE